MAEIIAAEPDSDSSVPAIHEVDARDGKGQRLDRFLAARLPQYSRSRIQRWIALGAVGCEQRALAAKTRLNGSEALVVEALPREADAAFVAEPVAFRIHAEGPAFLVVDKHAGLVVHPGSGNWSGTLMNGLLHHDSRLALLPRAGIVHRLDKDTSGLMIVARSEATREALVGQLADRSLSRRYLALCEGRFENEAMFDGAIGRDPFNRLRMAVIENGKPALTRVQALAVGEIGKTAVTLLECRLATGRTHQIRVHLSHAGHPLLGDRLYGARAGLADRQMLHAWSLGLSAPLPGIDGPWSCAPPADFMRVLAASGIDAGVLPVMP